MLKGVRKNMMNTILRTQYNILMVYCDVIYSKIQNLNLDINFCRIHIFLKFLKNVFIL